MTLPDAEFEQFFLQHYDHVVRSLTAMTGDAQTAQDAVQEAFVKASTRWRKVRRFDNPVAWVRRVAINASRDLHRSSERRRRREERAMSAHLRGHTEHRSPAATDQSLFVAQLLAELPTMQRRVAALYYVDDLAVAEIGRMLDISAGAVKFHLNRARNRLRAVVEEQGSELGVR